MPATRHRSHHGGGQGAADLLYLGSDCALARRMCGAAEARGVLAAFISARRIVDDMRVSDAISSEQGTTVAWDLGDLRVCSRRVRGVLNYLGAIPASLMVTYDSEDREYVHAELTSYLGFALSQFRNVINEPSRGCISGASDSLPYQWEFVIGAQVAVGVPSFEISVEPRPTANEIVTADFYDYTNWDPASRSCSSPEEDAVLLKYERPRGTPVLCWFVDDALQHLDATSGLPWNGARSSRPVTAMSDLVRKLREHLSLRMGQAIFFVEEREITFGSIMPFVTLEAGGAAAQGEFVDALMDALLR